MFGNVRPEIIAFLFPKWNNGYYTVPDDKQADYTPTCLLCRVTHGKNGCYGEKVPLICLCLIYKVLI